MTIDYVVNALDGCVIFECCFLIISNYMSKYLIDCNTLGYVGLPWV